MPPLRCGNGPVRQTKPGGVRRFGAALAGALTALVLSGCESTPSAPYRPPPANAPQAPVPALSSFHLDANSRGVIARVNGRAITDWELEMRLPVPYRDRTMWSDPAVMRMVVRTVQSLAENQILLDAAKEVGIEATESEVDEELKRVMEKQKLSPEEFRRQVEQTGRSYSAYRDEMREDIQRYKLINRYRTGVYVPPKEIREQYVKNPDTYTQEESVNIRMLVISSERTGGVEPAKAMADAIRRQLMVGGDFDALCAAYRIYTPEPSRAGVPIANVSRGKLPAAVEKVVFDASFLVPGDTPVLPYERDWAILRVSERRERKLRNFEDIQLQQGIFQERWYATTNVRRTELLKEFMMHASVEPPDLFPPGYPEEK
jgi:parvulin-like peptidyl-prolyl isomerase